MALVLNCDCDVEYPTKTLAELRQFLFDGLGFTDPLAIASPRTLSDLRDSVISELGFIGELGSATMALADLRAAVKDRLGLAAAVLTNSYAVSAMVGELMRAIGAGAQSSSPPPGMRDTLVADINEAQQQLWRRLELDKGGVTLPDLLSLDADTTTLDGALVLTWAKGLAKARLGQTDAKAYFDEVERILAGQIQRTPPNINDIIDAALREAQNTLYRRWELGSTGVITLGDLVADDDVTTLDAHLIQLLALAKLKTKAKQDDAKELQGEFEHALADMLKRSPPGLSVQVTRSLQSAHQTVLRRFEMGNSGQLIVNQFSADSDTPSCDGQPVYLLALANCMVKYKVGDAKLAMTEYEQYMQDALKRSPPDRKTVVDRCLKRAQEILYQRYPVFRMERWYTWTLVANERFYGIGSNDEQSASPPCTKTINPRHVTWVGVTDSTDNCWRPLRCGIAPGLYASPVVGVPTHYEIRQCLEIWPTPIAGWKLRVKGNFDLLPFESDDDVTSMDWQAVELQALADAKSHYRQPDAAKVQAELNQYVLSLVAGQHNTRRYIPGAVEPYNAVRPVMAATDN